MFRETRVVRVEHRDGGAALITDAEGTRYWSRNVLVIGRCRRALEAGSMVRLWSVSGWYYRDLWNAEEGVER